MKKMILSILLGLSFVTTLNAGPNNVPVVNITNVSYNRITGDFTLFVDANRTWEVWRSTNLLDWILVSGKMTPNKSVWVDKGIGLIQPMNFYMVRPATPFKRGWHYGWIKNHDLEWYWWYDNGPFGDK